MTYMPTSQEMNYFSNNSYTCYYCDNTTLSPNHGITIVGWDDNFSKDNFNGKSKPINNGAYLVLNSYGNDWGSNDGYYYISYDDYFIENGMFGIQEISNKDYDNIYQYDDLGWSYYLYATNENDNTLLDTIYLANCFTKKSNYPEKLSEVGIYINDTGTNISIFLNKNGKELDINKLNLIATANNLSCGYHTIVLNNKIMVENDFSIVVKYSNNSGAIAPVEMPIKDSKIYDTASANEGESFASTDGLSWIDITKINGYSEANACIKAFTINATQNDATGTNYIKNTNWKLIKGNNTTMLSGINEKTTINELLSATNYNNGYTVKAYKNGSQVTTGDVTTGTVIKIYEGSNMVQEYTIVIYGDTTGDGNIQSSDALAIVKNALNTTLLKNEIYLEAGRVTSSKRCTEEKPTAVDALACIKHKLGLSKISQY